MGKKEGKCGKEEAKDGREGRKRNGGTEESTVCQFSRCTK
jgi:hypothetical protein